MYNTFGPGDTFDLVAFWNESGPSSGVGTHSLGFEFNPNSSGRLNSIDIALEHVFGTNDAHVYLTDIFPSGPTPPSLETWTLTNLPKSEPPNLLYTPETLVSLLHPQLTTDTTYYLYEKETGDEYNGWSLGTGKGTIISSTNNSVYNVLTRANGNPPGAFRVTMQAPVPELINVFSLGGQMLAGCAVLWFQRRRRKASGSK